MNEVPAILGIPLPKFTEAEADAAAAEWGMNCGPSAIAAIGGFSLAELRPELGDFEQKGYTNPTLMWQILRRIGVHFQVATRPFKIGAGWPAFGLARVQWLGRWSAPNVDPRAAYRFTHWVGSCSLRGRGVGIWDVNCLNNGTGWVALAEWEQIIVPFITSRYKGANGRYEITHSVEIEPRPAALERFPA